MWDETYLLSELPSEDETKEEADFIVDVLNLQPGSTVLDLCCGQGRHGRKLANFGVDVIGLDNSRFLLNEAQNNTDADGGRLRLIEADMRHIPLKSSCNAVISLFTSFGFFEEKDNTNVISEIASVLKPDGRLLIDHWNPYAVAQLDHTRNWWWVSESTLALAEVEYQPQSGRLYDYRTIIELPTKSIRKMVNTVRFYFPTEMERLLKAVGLGIRATYGDFDGSDFNTGSRRMITVAEKST
ncbi:MAG: methyltransferase domain-containing protein [Candidatus Poribacteria bacterium]|nr:methyltransferase domain-containing protein [Candidatus Poribacteria bacterium]MDE0505751.1 methyltransferase domain-containing protein [Candidatus Poribacteria bacterium]